MIEQVGQRATTVDPAGMAEAIEVERIDGGFSVAFADGTRTRGRRLLLSHGVEDVLAETGRRLEAEYDRAVRDGFDSTANALWDEECEFWIDHGPRLLAVAEAGDRLYDYVHHAPICAGTSERPCDCGLVEALAAWDAAPK